MPIDSKTLEKLEKLSHLTIAEEKRDQVLRQMTEILEYVDNLNELDTDGLESHFSTLSGGTPMREDRPAGDPGIPRSILDHAPQSRDDFFIVPAVIDE